VQGGDAGELIEHGHPDSAHVPLHHRGPYDQLVAQGR